VKNEYEITFLTATSRFEDVPLGEWADLEAPYRQIVQINVSKFVSPVFYLEAISSVDGTRYRGTAFSLSGTAEYKVQQRLVVGEYKIRLFNIKIGSPVEGSEVDTYPATSYSIIRVIVLDTFVDLTTLEQQIEVGQVDSTTSTTYVALTRPILIKHESEKYDGVITAYFEATIYTTKTAKVAYAGLFENGVLIAELTTTSLEPVRLRSDAITLVDEKIYQVKIKQPDGYTMNLCGAKIILEQSGTITKTRSYRKIGNVRDWTGTTYIRLYCTQYLNRDNLLPTLTFYYEGIFANRYSNVCCSDLYDITRAKSIENSELCTPFGELEFLRYRSGALTLFPVTPPISYGNGLVWTQISGVEITEGEYDGRFKSDGETAMMANGYILIDGQTV